MRIDLCKIFGHKWERVVIGFKINTYTFITCFCRRCDFGHDELYKLIDDTGAEINTYNFDYFRKLKKETPVATKQQEQKEGK